MDDDTPFEFNENCFKHEINFIQVNGDSDYDPSIDPVNNDDRIRKMLPPA